MAARNLGTACGTAPGGKQNAPTEGAVKALQSNKFQNSWGGTRTRDPGIMSAVL